MNTKRTDVLVVGGSAAGIVAATTGKLYYPDKEFLLVRKEKQIIIPCGIPYIFGSLEDSNKDSISDDVLTDANINLKIGNVLSIDQKNKICKMDDDTEIIFEKLVLATGSLPIIPKWLKGIELENVFTISKNKEYIDEILTKLKDCKKIVTIGGGFIGVEVFDEINKTNKDVTIVEILSHILHLVFDEEITIEIEELIKSRGINVKIGVGVKEIIGEEKVTGVLLNDGEIIDADAVILSMGYKTNVSLAENSGIKINEIGSISVDKYMRTSNPDIFAVGDCAEKRDFITNKPIGIMLSSTACTEARVAGMNLYKLSSVKIFNGTIAIFSTSFENNSFGAVGLIEKNAIKEGFNVVTGSFNGVDKHPMSLIETHKQMVKLIASRESGIILGGEVIGGQSGGELINIIGLAIQNRMTVNSILTIQIGTHPLLTAPPTAYPIIKAAEIISKKLISKY